MTTTLDTTSGVPLVLSDNTTPIELTEGPIQMPNQCLPQIQACAMRIAVLDPVSYIPLPGSQNLYTTDALTEMTYDNTYQDGVEITESNACGATCIDYKSDDSKKRIEVSITICNHDPYLLAMLSGGDVINAGGAPGWAAPAIGTLPNRPISVEVWAKRINNGVLDPDYPYGWWVFPLVRNLREGQGKFSNASKLPVFTGQGYENENWFDGPLNDWPAEIGSTHQWIPTASLPTIHCGPTALAVS